MWPRLCTFSMSRGPSSSAHSWATLVALALALREPGAIAGLVLLSGYDYPTTRLDVASAEPSFAAGHRGCVAEHHHSSSFTRKCADGHQAYVCTYEGAGAQAALFCANGIPAFTTQIVCRRYGDHAVGGQAPSQRYAEIQLPVRIIAGIEDRIVTTARQSERLNRELHNSKLLLLEGTGHMTHHARPDLVSASVDELSDRPEGTQRVPAAAE